MADAARAVIEPIDADGDPSAPDLMATLAGAPSASGSGGAP